MSSDSAKPKDARCPNCAKKLAEISMRNDGGPVRVVIKCPRCHSRITLCLPDAKRESRIATVDG